MSTIEIEQRISKLESKIADFEKGIITQKVQIADQQGVPFLDNQLSMADNIVGTTQWLQLRGITNQMTNRLALKADEVFLSGALGIGTPKPSSGLHVEGSLIHSSGAGAGFSFTTRQSGAMNAPISTGESWVWYADAGTARLWSGTDKFAVMPTGNVGIGTTTPDVSLHVVGDTKVTGNMMVGAGGNGVLTTRHIDGKQFGADGSDPLFLNWSTSQPVYIGFGNDTVAGLLVSGWVGVGTIAPSHAFHVKSGDAVGLFESTGTQAYLRLATVEGIENRVEVANRPGGLLALWTGTDAVTINRAGNVGIGVGDTAHKLQVGGNIVFNDTIATPGRMHIDGQELLFLLNKQGVMVSKAWGGNGNLHVEGDLFLPGTIRGEVRIEGNLGTHGFSPQPRPGWAGGIHTWDVEAEGSIWTAHTISAQNVDLAENYLADGSLESGDVVCLNQIDESICIAKHAGDQKVIGVVSTAPGMLLGDVRKSETAKVVPVALCGRVPCKVSDENGPIRRGDLLTSSSTPGHAMKALPILIDGECIYRPGTIIGKALGSHMEGLGLIDVFVALH
jgi:hypothetical protein